MSRMHGPACSKVGMRKNHSFLLLFNYRSLGNLAKLACFLYIDNEASNCRLFRSNDLITLYMCLHKLLSSTYSFALKIVNSE